MKMKKFLSLGMVCVMALALTACGGSTSDTSKETTANTPAESVADNQNEGEAGEPGASSESGEKTINIGITSDPQVINPLNDNNGTAFELSKIMFLPLMSINDQLEFEPALAEGITTEDNITYYITLRQGVNWTDGEPLTADDVVFTLNTITNPEVGSTVASYLSSIVGTEDTGWMPEGTTELEGVEKISDYEIAITCKTAITMDSFLSNIANRLRTVPEHILSDVPAENILQSDFALLPNISNGPFVVNEYVSGQYIAMDSNPDYYKGAPKLAHLNFVILNNTQIATQLGTGEIDMAYPGSVEVGDYEQLTSLDFITSLSSAPVSVRELIINNEKVNDVNVRQAMNLAINRDIIVDQLMDGYANAQATVVTDASKYFNEEASKTTYDPEKAKELLGGSDWDTSQTLKLSVASGSELNTRIATLVAQELGEAGFNVEISESDQPTLMSGLFGRDFDLALMNITDDPMNLPFNFSALVQSASDWTGYSNDHMEELLTTITSLEDEATIAAAYQEIQAIIAEDVPAVTLYASRPLLFYNSRITYGEPKLYGMFADVELWDVQ